LTFRKNKKGKTAVHKGALTKGPGKRIVVGKQYQNKRRNKSYRNTDFQDMIPEEEEKEDEDSQLPMEP